MNSPSKQRFFLTTKQHEATQSKNKKKFVLLRVVSWSNLLPALAVLFCFVLLTENSLAQIKKPLPKAPPPKITSALNLPKVTQIDAEALKNLLKPAGKPLLVNFWATWCDPCREEFPDLVKIGADYKDRIDLITVSLDELSEINGDVPRFLAQMKADAPAYLLKTPDEGAAIAVVSKNWQGGLPFTILYSANGETVYIKQGKFKTDLLRAEIEKNINIQSQPVEQIQNLELPKNYDFYSNLNYEKGKTDAAADIVKGNLIIKRYGLVPGIDQNSLKKLKEKHGIEYSDYGCVVTNNLIEYIKGYNEISEAAVLKKCGTDWQRCSPIK